MKTENKEKTITIIYEPKCTGHRSMYVAHLMKFINSQASLHKKFLFILNRGMYELLYELTASKNYFLEFIEFDKRCGNFITRSFKEWDVVTEVIGKKHNIGGIIFMDIDPYLVLIASPRFRKFNLSVKGVLFEPYLHFKETNRRFSFFLKKVLKNYLLQKYSVLMNSNIHKIFILNDKDGVVLLNKTIKNIFFNLPDPIEDYSENIDPNKFINILEKYEIKPTKKNLLVFGTIDSRKNLFTIINAIILLPAKIKQDIHLIISGKIRIDVRDTYLERIENYKKEISIAYNDDFVKDEEREILFQSCDLVMIPYINYYGTSGVLGHAICYNKNVVAPNKGLLAKIVRRDKIGINVDPLNVNEIMEAIRQIISNKNKFSYDSQPLIPEYNPISFSKSILID